MTTGSTTVTRSDGTTVANESNVAKPQLVVKKHEITGQELQKVIAQVGRPWHNRRKPISVWKIRALRQFGFSYRQVGKVFGVSASTIKRRLKG